MPCQSSQEMLQDGAVLLCFFQFVHLDGLEEEAGIPGHFHFGLGCSFLVPMIMTRAIQVKACEVYKIGLPPPTPRPWMTNDIFSLLY